MLEDYRVGVAGAVALGGMSSTISRFENFQCPSSRLSTSS
jgi:hypothetical protein